MHTYSLRKLLFYISENCRAQKKQISRKLKFSPQRLNYYINILEKEKIIDYETIIDSAKFSYNTLLVGLVFTNFEIREQNQFIKYLNDQDNITSILRLTGGIDLLIEYTVPNLSFFNKSIDEMLDQYKNHVKITGINPIIVKHIYGRDYLYPKNSKKRHNIICGDRVPVNFSDKEKIIMKSLYDNPVSSIRDISLKNHIEPRTINKIIKNLEIDKTIIGFSINLHLSKISMNSSYLFIKLHGDRKYTLKAINTLSITIPEIKAVYKLLGDTDLLLVVESLGSTEKVIRKIRDSANFYDFKKYDYISTIKNKYLPSQAFEVEEEKNN